MATAKWSLSSVKCRRAMGLLGAFCVLGSPMTGYAWEKAYSCDGGAFVVDVQRGSQGPRIVEGQMVIRGNVARWLYEDLSVVTQTDFNPRGEIIEHTNYDERGNLNLAAFLTPNSERHGICLRFRPEQRALIVLQTNDGYCNVGRVIGQYQFSACWSALGGNRRFL